MYDKKWLNLIQLKIKVACLRLKYVRTPPDYGLPYKQTPVVVRSLYVCTYSIVSSALKRDDKHTN
jgi:hypothetical protein